MSAIERGQVLKDIVHISSNACNIVPNLTLLGDPQHAFLVKILPTLNPSSGLWVVVVVVSESCPKTF